MNDVINVLLNHRSIRKYKNQDISPEYLNVILNAAQAAPSSINAQGVSIIVVKDKDRKNKLSELVGNQPYVSEAPVFLIFCMDFNRTAKACKKKGVDIDIINSVEASLVGSVDVGLAMANSSIAAESLGLGIVPIGGIRKNPEEVIKMLNLPKYVFPICGLVVGYADEEPDKKPRLPQNVVVHNETYNELTDDQLNEYDELISEYLSSRTNGKDCSDWSDRISNIYRYVYYPKVKDTLNSQGFLFEK